MFEYSIFNKDTKDLIDSAKSIQVFLNMNRELMLTFPEFFINWKEMGLIRVCP